MITKRLEFKSKFKTENMVSTQNLKDNEKKLKRMQLQNSQMTDDKGKRKSFMEI